MFHDIFVKSAIALIESNVHEMVNIDELASVTGFAPDYFRQVFKKATGQTITQYIKDRKLSHAAFLLKNSTRKIADIAMEYGFGSHDVFIRRFRARFYAGWFMKEEAERFPEFECKLMEISGIFKKEHETAFEMLPFHGGLQMGENQARELAKKENRIKIAELIRKAENLDRHAADCMHALLSVMKK